MRVTCCSVCPLGGWEPCRSSDSTQYEQRTTNDGQPFARVDALLERRGDGLRRGGAQRRRPWSRIRLTATLPETAGPDRADDERPALVAALRRLPPRQRAVLVLRFLYDLPVGEVAALLECSEGTVKSQSSRGLAAMRRLLDEPLTTRTTAGSSHGH
jgi:RNA polymerase sigma factor (sigma-70 family)